jgi:hypothetical protein
MNTLDLQMNVLTVLTNIFINITCLNNNLSNYREFPKLTVMKYSELLSYYQDFAANTENNACEFECLIC